LTRAEVRLAISFDIDLGELVEGHHVVARGISRGRTLLVPDLDEIRKRTSQPVRVGETALQVSFEEVRKIEVEVEDELHYEFVPGVVESDQFSLWRLKVSDDLGTAYNSNDTGAYDHRSGGEAIHGSRDLGGRIPVEASVLLLRFDPGYQWEPPEPWCRRLKIDLESGSVIA
jgi:hypothetical protein